jgi:Icc-related predicted phosphoesterase
MKILICGDTHGDLNYAGGRIVNAALKNECEKIIVCGDFGLWEHTDWGLKFTQKLSKRLVENNLSLFFVDGNHENHDLLYAYHQDRISRTGKDGITEIKQNIYHIPRGHCFTFGNTNFMGFGGAFSIDRSSRQIRKSLWLGEEIIEEDYETAIKNFKEFDKPIDVLISHEGPCSPIRFSGKDDLNSVQQRQFIQRLINEVNPKKVYFGHYHAWVPFMYNETPCHCLPGTEYEGEEQDFVIEEV